MSVFSSSSAASAFTEPDLIIAGCLKLGDGWAPGEVWVSNGVITGIFPAGQAPATAAKRVDVGESFVLPGAIDSHVHCLSHAGEGVAAATTAAAAGGVTTIVEMPFDGPGPINTLDRLRTKQDLVNDEALIDVALLGTLAPNGGWREAGTLAENGVVGFKVSLFDTDPNRFPRINDYELLHVMQAVAEAERTLCTHAENNEVVKALLDEERRNSDPLDPQSHTRTRPPVSETLGVLTAMEIAATKGTALHVCHLSLPRSVDLAAWYQSQGADITLETCPHYLTFTSADLDKQKGRLKINPPLREEADRTGLWNRLDAGTISILSSDHAPWPKELKDHDVMLDNHSGAPGVETLVSMTLGAALQRDVTLESFEKAVTALTETPARRFGLDHRKGRLEAGYDADIMVFTPQTDYRIDETTLHSNAGWSPYNGLNPGGHVSLTVSRGTIVWNAESGVSTALGRGDILARK